MNEERYRKTKVLIVEDDDQLAALLTEYLQMHDFEVMRIGSGGEAQDKIEEIQPDLVILDLMLPGMDGLDICRQVRASFTGAILMLTASQSESDHVAGLELGADDFVTKPVEPRVLLARIRSQLRRMQGAQSSSKADKISLLEFGPLLVDASSRAITISGQSVPLTSMEFDVLELLARSAGSVVKREDLYTHAIGTPYDGIDRGLDIHVSRIRRKLQNAGYDATKLKSVRGVGYLLALR